MKYRITASTQLRQGWPVILSLLLHSTIPFFIWYQWGIERAVQLVWIVVAMYLFFTLIPAAALHMRYLACNRDLAIGFDCRAQSITVTRNGSATCFGVDEIDRVTVVASRAIKYNEVAFYPWQLYGYALITLKSKNELLITTLLISDLSWPFEMGPEEYVMSPFCWPGKVDMNWIGQS